MRTRGLTTALLVVWIVLATAPRARADDGGGAFVDPDGNPTAEARDGQSGDGGGGGGGDDSCEWRVIVEDDFDFAVYDQDFARQHSPTGRWLQRWCDGELVTVGGLSLVPEGGVADPHQIAVNALASVGIEGPSIRTSPSENGRLYVQVPTWLWVEPNWWQTYEATANAGRVWSTVRATPVATTWNLGDGGSVSCRGPGTAWRPGMSEDATDCTHTYLTSSASRPGDTFHLEAIVTLEVSWTSNAAAGGTLPSITRTSAVEVEVGEIQAIGTGGSS